VLDTPANEASKPSKNIGHVDSSMDGFLIRSTNIKGMPGISN